VEGARADYPAKSKVRGSPVVRLLAVGIEILNSRKEMAQQIQGRFAGLAAADFLDAFYAEVLVVDIARVAQAIGEKKERITGFEL
jgi:hypothetical protein